MMDDLERDLRQHFRQRASLAPDGSELSLPVDGAASRRPEARPWVMAGAAVVVIVGTAIAGSLVITNDRGREDPAGPAGPACEGPIVRTAPQDGATVPAFTTPREAAEAWAGPGAGDITVDADASYAYLRRPDGSVRASMRLESTRSDLEDSEPSAWSVDGSALCADEVSSSPWDGSDQLGCAADSRIVGVVDREARAGEERSGLALASDSRITDPYRLPWPEGEPVVRLTTGASSSDVTVSYRHRGTVDVVTRMVHESDRWRVASIAVCQAVAPRISPGTTDLRLIGLQVGHCWIGELRHDGQEWTALASDDFGWGGSQPSSWLGFGTVKRVGNQLVYHDLAGRQVRFLPTGSPGTTEAGMCA